MQAMILGQAPSRTSRVPLEGRVGQRLCAWAGLRDHDELNYVFALGNLLPEWPGKAGKGDAFPMEVARRHAAGLLEEVLIPEEWDLVLMLGWNVARAFGVAPRVGYLRQFMLTEGTYPVEGVVLPHPSGVNRWLNDEANVAELRRYMRVLVS